MKVFLTGGTGAIGRALLPHLVGAGHEVVALVRSPEKRRQVEAAGARSVIADPLDQAALTAAVRQARPHAIVHQLTALSGPMDFRNADAAFELTNRFRTETTEVLFAVARQTGVRRVLVQSFCGWPFARLGGPIKTEQDPLDPEPPKGIRRTLDAIRVQEKMVRRSADLEAKALRYGALYGPGTALAPDGWMVAELKRRRLPIVGSGAGIWSFLHVDDAATATALALQRGEPGIYNIVDDEPAQVATWLPALAQAVGAPPPRRIPAWIARYFIGETGVAMMTEVRGGSNARAKLELGWRPLYESWRTGFNARSQRACERGTTAEAPCTPASSGARGLPRFDPSRVRSPASPGSRGRVRRRHRRWPRRLR